MNRLTRSEPSRNMDRFYAMQLTPTLFGELGAAKAFPNGGIGTDRSGQTHLGENQAGLPGSCL